MRPLTLQEMAAAMGGRVFGPIESPTITSICTDSRSAASGALFFAIKGEQFDGHDFADAALASDASAVVVEDAACVAPRYRTQGRVIEVDDTIKALGRLAGWYRGQFAAQVVAVLGSNGKTTTKDLVTSVLSAGHRGRGAHASFNNAIGVPLTLLAVEPADEFVVVEIGTNQPGEIAALARIARPDMAVVTSIGEEHLAGFGAWAGVAREEFSFLPWMQNRGFVAMSAGPATHAPPPRSPRRQTARGDDDGPTRLVYGSEQHADLRVETTRQDADGQRFRVNDRFDYVLPLLGRHNVLNALAAIAIGIRFRMTHEHISKALADAEAPAMRLETLRLGSLTVINDAYNANPASMKCAFEALEGLSVVGRRVLVLGDMKELGQAAARCHSDVGRAAASSPADVIACVGAFARIVADGATAVAGTSKRIYAYPSIEALERKLPQLLEPGDVVLIKASRSVNLDRIIPTLDKCGKAMPA